MQRPDPAGAPASVPRVVALSGGLVAVLALTAFIDSGGKYLDFTVPQTGGTFVDPLELSFFVWYVMWGLLAVAGLTVALFGTSLPNRLLSLLSGAARRRALTLWSAAVLAMLGALLVRLLVLRGDVIADDELVYAFQAQTLAAGHIVNPPPEQEFFSNIFVVVNERGWFGKYPIGHPALLALGELLGARGLVVPLIGLCSVLLTFAVGRKLFGTTAALLGAALLCVSPQFVCTHATQMSQPSSALLTLALLWAVLELDDSRRMRAAALAGLFGGALLLIRPLPGALFVAACMAGRLALLGSVRPALGRFLRELLAAGPGLAIGIGLLALTNFLQSGSPFISGYHVSDGALTGFDTSQGALSVSVGAALLRQNFWLFGWICSFAFLPFSRFDRRTAVLWLLVAAEFAYRILAPKTVVATTGPIYVFEIVPLLALATADGILRCARGLHRHGITGGERWITSLTVAMSLVALLAFMPFQVVAMSKSSTARSRVGRLLAQEGAEQALVFCNVLVVPQRRVTWAYGPPNPKPDFSDPIIFARIPRHRDEWRNAYEMWRKRFPERRAFVFNDAPNGAHFAELDPPQGPDTAPAHEHDATSLKGRGAADNPGPAP
jgi:hypothetical protein